MFGINSGLSALTAARLAIETVGHNLANATTPGYSRQRVTFETERGNFSGGSRIGGGVLARDIERVTDRLLIGRVRSQVQDVGRRETTLGVLSDIEAAFGEPGEAGLSAHLTDFFNGLSGLATTPEGPQRGAVVHTGSALADRLRQVRGELSTIGTDVQRAISDVTGEINRLSGTLAGINRQLALSASGTPPSDLLDRQSQTLEELSLLVDIAVTNGSGGRVSVHAGGQVLVSNSRAHELRVVTTPDGGAAVRLQDSPYDVAVKGGRLSGLIDAHENGASGRVDQLDRLASELIFEFNKRHATGIPRSGGFTSLVADRALTDIDGDGDLLDTPLTNLGLPGTINKGALTVSVRNRSTGAVEQTTIDIDPSTQTAGDFVNALKAIPGLDAAIDSSGRLVVSATAGRDFHFAAVVDPQPDDHGTFGAKAAQLVGGATEPFALSHLSVLSITVNGGTSQDVTLDSAQFADISQATADEVAAAINARITGAVARVVDGRVVLATNATGTAATLNVSGAPAAALGLSTSPETGSALAVSVRASGHYSGGTNDVLTFRPLGTGTIGVTPGLSVEVVSGDGTVLRTIDVGNDYAPGSEIDLGKGVRVAFGPGDISERAGDYFELALRSESDTAGILATLGLNSFFTGTNASNIEIAARLRDDPNLLSIGLDAAVGDSANVARLLALRDDGLGGLGDLSLADFYGNVIADVGRDTARSESGLETQTQLLESMQGRLEQIRGVSIDEELANLQRFEQSFEAASRYIAAVNDLTQVLFSI